MISNEIRKNIIDELAKDGNILSTCKKVGIAPATFYRWRKEDPGFRKRVQQAEQIGRQNMSCAANHALLLLVKEKNLPAIKWYQTHNDPRYRPKVRKIFIEHSNAFKEREARVTAEEKRQIDEATESIKQMVESMEERRELHNESENEE